MKLTIYQIDAFASKIFEGNPAAICPLMQWLPDELMQSIAAENNLSETAFFVATESGFHIRWFTPLHEVDLCGHATLAAAYVIFEQLEKSKNKVEFLSNSGTLLVTKKADALELNFPAQPATACEVPDAIANAFEVMPLKCLKSQDYIVVFDSEEIVLNAKPNLELLSQLDLRGVAITSLAKNYDFVTRFFAPKYGINEDPVTGSAFTQLIPYWSDKLNKKILSAKQVSKRGGEVSCINDGERVRISGRAVQYMRGQIDV